MATQPRVMQSKPKPNPYRKAESLPLTGVPGVLAGLGIGVVFLTLATGMRFNSAENIMIMVLITVLSATFFGVIAHLLGEALVANEAASSTTQFFKGSVGAAKLVHNVFWVVSFFAISGLLAASNPEAALKARAHAAALKNVQPEQMPIPVPPSPAGNRRSAAQSGGMEDPNRIKSSPSRFEKGDGASPGAPAEQRAARDAMVVDALKGAGLRVEDVIYAPPAPSP